jgi:hypothetical protein
MSIHAKPEQPQALSLKDRLNSLTVTSAGSCAFGRLANELDSETREALFDAMRSSASSNSICNSLREAGFTIARSTVVQKRACFTAAGSSRCECFPDKYTEEV